jgi:hypothetical protein
MSVDELLDTPEKRAFLREKLEKLIEKHGFSTRINNFVDEMLRKERSDYIDVNLVYKHLYDFTASNLPTEVQEEFYYDVRAFIDKKQ